jgi:putative ribose-phosphate pyrophosphokinase
MAQQSVKYKEYVHNFAVGTGKDCKLFLNIVTEENGAKKFYQLPLTTIVSIQVFTSNDKEPRWTFGSADPRGLTEGFKYIRGHLTSVVLNESIGARIRRMMKYYKPVDGSKLKLDTNGVIDLKELDSFQHMDQLPPCEIKMYFTNPVNKKVYSVSIIGVKFTSSGYSIGGSATMGEQFSFEAVARTEVKEEDVQNKSQLVPGKVI